MFIRLLSPTPACCSSAQSVQDTKKAQCIIISVALPLFVQAHPSCRVKIGFWAESSSCAAADAPKARRRPRAFREFWVRTPLPSRHLSIGSISKMSNCAGKTGRKRGRPLPAGGPCFSFHNQALVSHPSSQTSHRGVNSETSGKAKRLNTD